MTTAALDLTHEQRSRIVKELKQVWTARDIGFIPDRDLRSMNDENLSYLLRFWTHKNRYWDALLAPSFTELPPHGHGFNLPPGGEQVYFTGADLATTLTTTLTPQGNFTTTDPAGKPIGRTFRGSSAGGLVNRQRAKRH